MADLADSITSARFAEPMAVETKPDGTHATAADREVEEGCPAMGRYNRPLASGHATGSAPRARGSTIDAHPVSVTTTEPVFWVKS
jgi:hypothetical protein